MDIDTEQVDTFDFSNTKRALDVDDLMSSDHEGNLDSAAPLSTPATLQPAQAEPPAIVPNRFRCKELDEAIPTNFQTYTQMAPYFNIPKESKKEFISMVNESRIPKDIQIFDKIRDKFRDAHQGKDFRPSLGDILGRITNYRETSSGEFEIGMDDLAEEDHEDPLRLFAIVYEKFYRRWFMEPNAPFRHLPIEKDLIMDRVNGLVKLQDRGTGGRYANLGSKARAKLPKKPQKDWVLPPRKNKSKPSAPPLQSVTAIAGGLLNAATTDNSGDAAALVTTDVEDLPADGENSLHPHKRLTTAVPHQPETSKTINKTRKIKGVHITDRLGMNTSVPSSGVKRRNIAPPTMKHTPDANNPRDFWFREGRVIGYKAELVQELKDFKETDWVCDDDDREPTFNPGGDNAPEIQAITVEIGKTPAKMLQLINDTITTKETAAAEALKAKQKEQETTEKGEGPAATTSSDETNESKSCGDEAVKSTETGEAAADKIDIKNDPEYDIARKAAKALRHRIDRLKTVRQATGLRLGEAMPKNAAAPDSDKTFYQSLLAEQRYDDLSACELPTDSTGNEDEENDPNKPKTANVNDESLRLNADQASRMMNNKAFQPRDYKSALNNLKVARRKRPILPGQNINDHPDTWWQITAASNMYDRRIRNLEKRLSQLKQNLEKKVVNAKAASLTEVECGCILADVVGIGKTRTAGLQRLAVS